MHPLKVQKKQLRKQLKKIRRLTQETRELGIYNVTTKPHPRRSGSTITLPELARLYRIASMPTASQTPPAP